MRYVHEAENEAEAKTHEAEATKFGRTGLEDLTSLMERGFNAGQKHRRIYPSIFNRFRARSIARYWSEIATFPTPCI